jgi:LAO/AO transport system kinase
MSLVDDLLNGDRRALARLITQVEDGAAGTTEALAALFPRTGQAHLVGVTGAPGTGKSTLVNQAPRREDRRSPGRRPDQPLQRRRDPRRPHPHARPGR